MNSDKIDQERGTLRSSFSPSFSRPIESVEKRETKRNNLTNLAPRLLVEAALNGWGYR